MQKRYAGDAGDFGKFGLLRRLENTDLTVGINWYLVADEDHNQVLTPPSKSDPDFRTKWLARSFDHLSGCDLVFLGPDNGMRPKRHYPGLFLPFAGRTCGKGRAVPG